MLLLASNKNTPCTAAKHFIRERKIKRLVRRLIVSHVPSGSLDVPALLTCSDLHTVLYACLEQYFGGGTVVGAWAKFSCVCAGGEPWVFCTELRTTECHCVAECAIRLQ